MDPTPAFSRGDIPNLYEFEDIYKEFKLASPHPATKTVEIASRFFGSNPKDSKEFLSDVTPIQYVKNQRWALGRAHDYLDHRSSFTRFIDTILSFFRVGEVYKVNQQIDKIKHPNFVRRNAVLKQLDKETDWYSIESALDREIGKLSQSKELKGDEALIQFFKTEPTLEQIVLRVKRSRTKDLIEVYNFISQNTTDAKELQLYILQEILKRSGKELTEHNFPRLLESIKTQVRKGDQKELLDKFDAKLNHSDESERINRFQKEHKMDAETLSRIDKELVHIRDKKWANVDQESAVKFFTAYPSAEELMWSIKYAKIGELLQINELLDKKSQISQLIVKEIDSRSVIFKKKPS